MTGWITEVLDNERRSKRSGRRLPIQDGMTLSTQPLDLTKDSSEQVVRDISELKDEPEWMTEIRVKAFHHFMKVEMPKWGNTELLESINFDNVTYFLRSSDKTEKNGMMFLRISIRSID